MGYLLFTSTTAVQRCCCMARPRASWGSLPAIGGGERLGVGVELEARQLAAPDGEEVRALRGELPAAGAHRPGGVDQADHPIPLRDELVGLEPREGDVLPERAEEAADLRFAMERP